VGGGDVGLGEGGVGWGGCERRGKERTRGDLEECAYYPGWHGWKRKKD